MRLLVMAMPPASNALRSSSAAAAIACIICTGYLLTCMLTEVDANELGRAMGVLGKGEMGKRRLERCSRHREERWTWSGRRKRFPITNPLGQQVNTDRPTDRSTD